MKNVLSIILFSLLLGFIAACQNKITLPNLAFKTDVGYVFDDITVGLGDTLMVGINASTEKKGQSLQTFKVSSVYDNNSNTLSTVLSETLTAAQATEYSKDLQLVARNQAGIETYTFSILDAEGLENSVSLTLTVQ